nr:MAG TPA_asm: putative surface protein family protein [Bacteriophage sp.]
MKKEKGLIIAVMVLFLVSGVAACIFKQYRDGQENEPAPVYVNQDRESQPQTTEKTEGTQEQKSEETQEQKPEETTETEPVQETGTDQSEAEKPGSEQSGSEQSETEQPVSVYYAFTVRGDISSLNLRSVPDMDGKILGRLMPKQTGYVLEYGEEWSLVTNGKKSGYVNNRYIELEEIPEEDFPAEYRE